MPKKTWFLPPDFNFLPEGELALGTVIQYPSRPTLALAALSRDHPTITLPKIIDLSENGHKHGTNSKRSFSADLLAKCIDLASASGNIALSRYKNRSLGSVDIELRSFSEGILPKSLQEIVALERVKKYIDDGMFGKRPVYIISGLRIAKDSFEVTDEVGSSTTLSTSASGPTPTAVPLEIGGGLSVSRENNRTDGFMTAPGVVYAYRLHVIRSKRDGDVETELFSHRTGFLTGEDDDEETVEMDCTEVTADVVNDDIEVEPDFEEHVLGDGEESFVIFKTAG